MVLEPLWEVIYKSNFFALTKQDNKFRNALTKEFLIKFIKDLYKFMYLNNLKQMFRIQDTQFWTEKEKEIIKKIEDLDL